MMLYIDQTVIVSSYNIQEQQWNNICHNYGGVGLQKSNNTGFSRQNKTSPQCNMLQIIRSYRQHTTTHRWRMSTTSQQACLNTSRLKHKQHQKRRLNWRKGNLVNLSVKSSWCQTKASCSSCWHNWTSYSSDFKLVHLNYNSI